MNLDSGDLVLVPFPFADLSSSKTRPALVMSTTAYNERNPDVILCSVTANLADAAHTVLIEPGDMASGRLAAPSRVRVDKVATLEKTLVRRRVGQVKSSVFSQVLKEFFRLFPAPG